MKKFELRKIIREELLKEKYNLGDRWSRNFDYTDMLELGAKITIAMGAVKLRKLFDSFEDVNYHTPSMPLWSAINKLKDGDKSGAISDLKKFNNACKKELKLNKPSF